MIEKEIQGEIVVLVANLCCGRTGVKGAARKTRASLALNLWASLSDSCALGGEELQHLICVLHRFTSKTLIIGLSKILNSLQNTFLPRCCSLIESFTSLQLRTIKNARTNQTHDFMLWQPIGVQEHLEWHWLRDGQLPSWWNPSTGIASPWTNFSKNVLTNIATTFYFGIPNLVRCCRLELLGWAWCSLSLCDFTWVPRMKDLQQRTINCTGLLAGLGRSGKFERKLVETWGNFRKIDEFWEEIIHNEESLGGINSTLTYSKKKSNRCVLGWYLCHNKISIFIPVSL